MSILAWMESHRPGVQTRHPDRIEIAHLSGETSTLWLRSSPAGIPDGLGDVSDLYTLFDGADLFSGAFKIASVEKAKRKGTDTPIPSLSELAEDFEALGGRFEEPATVFMLEASGWYYAVSHQTARILCWDSKSFVHGEPYDSVLDVFDEWLSSDEDKL